MSTCFEHFRRSSPIIPKDTCPDINKAIDLLDEAEAVLERIRKANSDLRELSMYWRESCKEACDELEESENTTVSLEARIAELESDLRQLEGN